MNRVRPLLLVLLAIAACQTEKKPLIGFDEPPSGSIVLGFNGMNTVLVWPIFDLSQSEFQIFRFRLDGQDVVNMTSPAGFYDYASLYLYGWTGGYPSSLGGIPSGSHTVEVADGGGQSWGRSAPLLISSGDGFPTNASLAPQLPTVVLTHYDGQIGSWTIDPTTQDSDEATDEITVTNLLAEDVVVERCSIAAGERSSCALVGTVAPGADLFTVEQVAGSATADHQALLIHLASDANESHQRDLVPGANGRVNNCQMERILVHGKRATVNGITGFAMSSCYGYAS